jgi:CRP-like cAMP-binding protein
VAPHNQLQNRILRQLPAHELKVVEPLLSYVELKHETVLQPAEEEIKQVYFPLSGMVSLLSVMRCGDAIETGIVGSDGIVGWRQLRNRRKDDVRASNGPKRHLP